MTPAVLDLQAFRNAPFPPDEFSLTEGGEPLDITDMTFAMDVRAYEGAPSALISIGTADIPGNNGIYVLSGVNGTFRIQITQAAMQSAWDAAYAAGVCRAGETASLVWDLRIEHADGLVEVPLAGAFHINPGVSL